MLQMNMREYLVDGATRNTSTGSSLSLIDKPTTDRPVGTIEPFLGARVAQTPGQCWLP